MRRSIVGFISLAVLLATLLMGGGHTISAQDTASSDASGHPLVGTWQLVVEGDSGCPSQVIFTSDGAYIDTSCDGTVIVGVWEPTGDQTANLSITQVDAEGTFVTRASVEVAGDGQSFAAEYTFEVIDPETGEGMGEYGPGTASGTRHAAEGPGTPVGSIEDLFAMYEEEEPEATPAS